MECYLSLLNGKTAKETAKVLRISAKTVEGYIETVKQKLRCHNRSQLFEQASSLGLISIL
ncbi:MAG: LuxR C-terminal-related transcriptional regulator [Gammaproteobacteria bacterium]|nr:LuxR C-terminal-related transcriptional regulator [Gammaproteobacteria bacterium]MBU2546217.1 LuxR C-terminal-related transcriptional regulator [Gammaproteobacteria bacterium]